MQRHHKIFTKPTNQHTDDLRPAMVSMNTASAEMQISAHGKAKLMHTGEWGRRENLK